MRGRLPPAAPSSCSRSSPTRAERSTVLLATGLPFSEWTQVIHNARLCKALLDRITHRAHIIKTGSDSYGFHRTLEPPVVTARTAANGLSPAARISPEKGSAPHPHRPRETTTATAVVSQLLHSSRRGC
jgi:IstB-like ATP binding protein